MLQVNEYDARSNAQYSFKGFMWGIALTQQAFLLSAQVEVFPFELGFPRHMHCKFDVLSSKKFGNENVAKTCSKEG